MNLKKKSLHYKIYKFSFNKEYDGDWLIYLINILFTILLFPITLFGYLIKKILKEEKSNISNFQAGWTILVLIAILLLFIFLFFSTYICISLFLNGNHSPEILLFLIYILIIILSPIIIFFDNIYSKINISKVNWK